MRGRAREGGKEGRQPTKSAAAAFPVFSPAPSLYIMLVCRILGARVFPLLPVNSPELAVVATAEPRGDTLEESDPHVS